MKKWFITELYQEEFYSRWGCRVIGGVYANSYADAVLLGAEKFGALIQDCNLSAKQYNPDYD